MAEISTKDGQSSGSSHKKIKVGSSQAKADAITGRAFVGDHPDVNGR